MRGNKEEICKFVYGVIFSFLAWRSLLAQRNCFCFFRLEQVSLAVPPVRSMVAESVTPTLQQQRPRYPDQETSYAHHHHHHQVQQQHHPSQHQMNSERRSVHSPPGQSLLAIHNPHGSSAMDERAAALHAAAAAAAAAGFSPAGLPVGLDLSGLANLSGLSPHHGSSGSNGSNSSAAAAAAAALNNQRKQREFIPDNKKDDSYWDRRRRNNEAAKRSREKRRLNDMVLEQRVLELSKENHILRAQLSAIRDKYGVTADNLISIDQVLSTLPAPDQMLSVPRPRSRMLPGLSSLGSVSPISMGCSQRSMSPPQHSSSNSSSNLPAAQQRQQQQQRRQSVLMSMGRQRSPSPASGAHHVYANENNGGRSNGFHRGYSMVDAIGSSGQSAFRQEYLAHDNARAERPAEKQLRHSLSVDNSGRPLPPLPALTPVPMTSPPTSLSPRKKCRSPADDSAAPRTREIERSGNVVGYFDLCSSSSSSSANCGSGSNSGDEGSHSPISSSIDANAAAHRLLPHKLRHKTHLGDRDAATAAAALLTLNDIKHEPEMETETEMSMEAEDMSTAEENGCRSSGGSTGDERDSGLSGCEWSSLTRSSSTSSSTSGRDTSSASGEPEAKKKRIRISSVYSVASLNDQDANGQDSDGLNYAENDELRSKVARLVSEVETLKNLLGGGVRFNLS